MEIEKNVPVPSDAFTPNRRKYPFAEMAVGDSIVVDGDRANTAHCKAYGAAINYGRRNGKVFVGRKEPDQPGKTRIWRIE